MPEWLLQILITAAFAALGGLISWVGGMVKQVLLQLSILDKRQDAVDLKFTNCVTWDDLKDVGLRVDNHEKRLTIVETVCHQRHD